MRGEERQDCRDARDPEVLRASAPIRRPATSMTCGGSTAGKAASWSSVRTSTLPMSCRSMRTVSLPITSLASSARVMMIAIERHSDSGAIASRLRVGLAVPRRHVADNAHSDAPLNRRTSNSFRREARPVPCGSCSEPRRGEPGGAVNLRKLPDVARAGWPLQRERVALNHRGIDVRFDCPNVDQLA